MIVVVYHLTSNCLQGSLVGCSLHAEVQNTASTNHRENTDPYAYVITLEFFASNPQRPWRGDELSTWRWTLFSQAIAFLISLTAVSLQYSFLLSHFSFCFKPGEDVAHRSQFLVDGPCHVLFSRELQQPSIGRCFCRLCGTRGFCAWCCGPPHVCSHILWTYSVADCCRVVYHPRRPGY